jgi:hypothetical protein
MPLKWNVAVVRPDVAPVSSAGEGSNPHRGAGVEHWGGS